MGHHRESPLVPLERLTIGPKPGNIREPAFIDWFAGQVRSAPHSGLIPPETDERLHEPQHFAVVLNETPIKPTGFVVLTISVVIAILCAPDFITADEHWHTLTEQQRAHHVLDLSITNEIHGGDVGLTLNTIVITDVVIITIAIVFVIGFIVLVLE